MSTVARLALGAGFGGLLIGLGVHTIRKPQRQARVMARNMSLLTREKSPDWRDYVGFACVSGVVAIVVGVAWALFIIVE